MPLLAHMVLSWQMDQNIVATTVYKPNIWKCSIFLALHYSAKENPDVLACETVPCYDEAIAIARALCDPLTTKGIPAWISFSCKDEHHISSGETIIKCAEMIDKVRQITGIRD